MESFATQTTVDITDLGLTKGGKYNILINGTRGKGKTTLIKNLLTELHDENTSITIHSNDTDYQSYENMKVTTEKTYTREIIVYDCVSLYDNELLYNLDNPNFTVILAIQFASIVKPVIRSRFTHVAFFNDQNRGTLQHLWTNYASFIEFKLFAQIKLKSYEYLFVTIRNSELKICQTDPTKCNGFSCIYVHNSTYQHKNIKTDVLYKDLLEKVDKTINELKQIKDGIRLLCQQNTA
uniref:Uncharacterized protein n=1 Tax=viral metagenome TaxID=1070528 RepID=A0A6C0ECC8_9ZZZZ